MARSLGALLLLLIAGASAGCRVGGNWDAAIVESPLGATVEIRNETGTREAELLLVQDDGVVALIDGQVTLARWSAMRRLTFRRVPVSYLLNGAEPRPAHREKMRTVSRYPSGLTDAQLAALLASFGQTSIATLR